MADMLNDGNIKVSYVPSIADITAPTVTELTAGTSLECLITADGLALTTEEGVVETPKLCQTSNAQAPGRTTYSVALTMVRQDETADDIGWTTMLRGTDGFLVIRYGTPYEQEFASGDVVHVYPGKAGQRMPQQPEANAATKFISTWYVSKDPDLDSAVASSV